MLPVEVSATQDRSQLACTQPENRPGPSRSGSRTPRTQEARLGRGRVGVGRPSVPPPASASLCGQTCTLPLEISSAHSQPPPGGRSGARGKDSAASYVKGRAEVTLPLREGEAPPFPACPQPPQEENPGEAGNRYLSDFPSQRWKTPLSPSRTLSLGGAGPKKGRAKAPAGQGRT